MTKAEALSALRADIRNCKLCGLRSSATQTVPGEGSGDASIFIVGEAPGADEDEQGRPFVGRAGKVLDQAIEDAGLDREAMYIHNILSCRPENNQFPSGEATQVPTCLPYVRRGLSVIQPEVVIALGANAYSSLFDHRKAKITEERGKVFMYLFEGGGGHPYSLPVVLAYHPSYVARKGGASSREHKELVADLQLAAAISRPSSEVPELLDGFISRLGEPLGLLAKESLRRAPDTFLTAPASSSGKHHPPWANESGGLLSHSLGVAYIAGKITMGLGHDELVPAMHAAGLLHDLVKWGYGSHGDKSDYKLHDVISSAYIGMIAERLGIYEDVVRVLCAIATHSGQWGTYHPRIWYELVLHVSDLLMSCKAMPDPIQVSMTANDSGALLSEIGRMREYTHIPESKGVLVQAGAVAGNLTSGFARPLIRGV